MWVTAWFHHLYVLGQNKTIYILNYKNKKYNIMLSLHKFGIILCQKPGKQPFPCMLCVWCLTDIETYCRLKNFLLKMFYEGVSLKNGLCSLLYMTFSSFFQNKCNHFHWLSKCSKVLNQMSNVWFLSHIISTIASLFQWHIWFYTCLLKLKDIFLVLLLLRYCHSLWLLSWPL